MNVANLTPFWKHLLLDNHNLYRWTHLPGLLIYIGDFFLRVMLRFISHLETILKTIFSENNCQIENSLQTENKPPSEQIHSHQNCPGRCVDLNLFFTVLLFLLGWSCLLVKQRKANWSLKKWAHLSLSCPYLRKAVKIILVGSLL